MKYQRIAFSHPSLGALALAILLAAAGLAPASAATRLAPRNAPTGQSREYHSGAADIGYDREQEIYALHARWASGETLALEEVELLNRFISREPFTALDADVLLSRVLYAAYILHGSLDPVQGALLSAYRERLAAEGREIADERVERELAASHAAARVESVSAAAPSNDTCAGAELLPDGPYPVLSKVVRMTSATANGDPAGTCGPAFTGVWYTFTPGTSGQYKFSTCADEPTATTVNQTRLSLYTSAASCAGPFVDPFAGTNLAVVCDSSSCNAEADQASFTRPLTAGTQYFILVWADQTKITPRNEDVQLRVDRLPTPSNDTCAGAISLALNIPVAGTLFNATNDFRVAPDAPCFTPTSLPQNSDGPDVIYFFQAPTAGVYTVIADQILAENATQSSFESTNCVLYAINSCPSSSGPTTLSCGTVAQAVDRGQLESSEAVTVSLGQSQSMFFVVDSTSGSEQVPYRFRITVRKRTGIEREPNDSTLSALPLICGMETVTSSVSDVDFFRLGTIASGSRVFAVADTRGSVTNPLEMRLTTSSTTVEYDFSGANAGFGLNLENADIAGAIAPGGALFLRVNEKDIVGDPVPAGGICRLHAVVQPAISSATQESEPNDTRGTADGAANNYFRGALIGTITDPDADVFRFSAAAGDELSIGLDADPLRDNSPFSVKMALIDPNGNVVQEAIGGNQVSPGFGGSGLTATLPDTLAATILTHAAVSGTYYVRIEGGIPRTTVGDQGDYLLSIAKNCVKGGGDAVSGGGADTPGIFDRANGAWFLRNANSNGGADLTFFFGPAASNFTALTGDWNGDGVDTPGLYDPASGAWFLTNQNANGPASDTFFFGGGGAVVPLTGDWDGDGVDTIGLYDPSIGAFFLRNSNSSGEADLIFFFGSSNAGFTPVAGDWNGDGVDTIGLYQPANGFFFLRNVNDNGAADVTFQFGGGGAGILPLTGDWNGDGVETIGLYNGQSGAWFLRNANAGGGADLTFFFGNPNSIPVTGDWNGQ